MKNIFKMISLIALGMVFSLCLSAMDNPRNLDIDIVLKKHENVSKYRISCPGITPVYLAAEGFDRLKRPCKDENDLMAVIDFMQKINNVLKKLPKNVNPPLQLVKALGNGIGLFCYYSPTTLPQIEEMILPYLQNGMLSHDDCKTPNFSFKFGLLEGAKINRISDNRSVKMPNGQILESHYHINHPVYFNRYYSEFKGHNLLIGGGKKCACGEAQNKHPQNKFFHMDIDNDKLPDVIGHAGYEDHLLGLPTSQFDFLWFEHCTIAELMMDSYSNVLNQYFRILNPGAIILFQSNYYKVNDRQKKIIALEECFNRLIRNFESYKFVTLENKEFIVLNGHSKYKQIIFMKPLPLMPNNEASINKMMDDEPNFKIHFGYCRVPYKWEQFSGLLRAYERGKLNFLDFDREFEIDFPMEKILSWIPAKKGEEKT